LPYPSLSFILAPKLFFVFYCKLTNNLHSLGHVYTAHGCSDFFFPEKAAQKHLLWQYAFQTKAQGDQTTEKAHSLLTFTHG
jgi:hypothetical protein